ncbi:MAG TPA: zinc-binding dehydrogenase [Gemmatimonadales bacterium]|nr:zinc-binding dehydrogenase [Gemmatimonadales bacterium]
MRALALTGTGDPAPLIATDLPAPAPPAPGWVHVRIKAAALNRLDLFVASGIPGAAPHFPHIVGSDGAGVVAAVGPGVTTARVGDEVMFCPGVSCGSCEACRAGDDPFCATYGILGEHLSGTAAEIVAVPARNLAPRPAGWSWAESAAFSLAALTVWRMLVSRAKLRRGETVLVWGAGGGVAQMAIQVAAHLGARVLATSSSPEKCALARTLGAERTFDHAKDDVVAAVKEATDRKGCAVVVETVGQATWDRSLRLLARGGRLVCCGATTGPDARFDLRRLFWHQWSLLGSTMGSLAEYQAVAALAQQGSLRPVVDSVVPLDRAADAYRRLASGAQSGKLVIEVSP